MARTTPAVELDAGGRSVRVSNPDKVYFAERGLTKLDVVQYFLSVGDGILGALRDRPTTLERWPSGVFEGAKLSTRADNRGDAFYQKRVPQGAPDYVQTATITFPSGRTADEVCPTELAVVAYCANLGTLTFHPWPVRRAERRSARPAADRPRPAAGDGLLRRRPGLAARLRALLQELGMDGHPEDLRRPRPARVRADRAAVDVRAGPAGRHRLRPGAGTPHARARDDELVEGGARRADLHRLQPDGPGPDHRVRLFGPGEPAGAGVGAAALGRGAATSCRTTST